MGITSADLQHKGRIEATFPNLVKCDYSITSPFDTKYNCIAWAAEDTTHWWWPDPYGLKYWPSGVPRQETVLAFQKAFETLGYEACTNGDLEIGFQKIAFYVDAAGVPQHGARQSPKGVWLSKLGMLPDIEHDLLEGLFSQLYGSTIGLFMRRAVTVHEA